MCELFCLSSRLPTVVSFSLEAFARRGGSDSRNLDGWGLAYYDDRDVRLYREPEPAGDSAWLSFVERRRVASTLVLSHLRHATRGRLSLANTQPFARELGGRLHVFAHNADLTVSNSTRPARETASGRSVIPTRKSRSASCSNALLNCGEGA